MSLKPAPSRTTRIRLEPFDKLYCSQVAGWVQTEQDLLWLAPRTRPPLTPSRLAAWLTAEANPFLAYAPDTTEPVGYAEVNPLRSQQKHFWLGHVIIRPDRRGEGLGLGLVQMLLAQAFEAYMAVRVSLVVFPENKPAVICYKRAGMRVVGRERHRFRDDLPEHALLRLEISLQEYLRTR